MQTLQNIWTEIGLQEEQKEERTKSVLFHLRNLLQDMVSEEEELKATLQANVETCTQELEKLSAELGLPVLKVNDKRSGPFHFISPPPPLLMRFCEGVKKNRLFF